jgi:SAM-dependent methyltransferase
MQHDSTDHVGSDVRAPAPPEAFADAALACLDSLESQGRAQARELSHHGTLVRRLARAADAAAARWCSPVGPLDIADHLAFLRRAAELHGLSLSGATHLVLGDGSSRAIATMFGHLLLGASKVVGDDVAIPSEIQDGVRYLAHLAARAILDPASVGANPAAGRDLLDHLRGFDLAAMLRGDPSGIDQERLVLRAGPRPQSQVGSELFDLVSTEGMLEATHELDPAIRECARWTKPGAFCLHHIDTADPRRHELLGVHPLEFLTISEDAPMLFGRNRLRLRDYEAIFTRNGWRIVDYQVTERVPIEPSLRERLAPKWRNLTDEELSATGARVLVRRA